ncbi:MAG TPA: cyclic nucleotide-binding domain-containing protein [Spirochaetota bacterium]|nr:cyclic nucleotide-binding domain-containing protein [Spirochaetota bacterium]HPC42964.1 cyclic nucleotide-binding domain-containing protein [Spirochaetota bacterium]HQF07621.1 cyclic nucleotide-binding domain-containing protein [Spirochaetota bacterium]HQH96352.1 cyclic nucleotide-binding domain-containing protein [Spirochaetota bacterium]HQJ69526.1 cyclic nucleotide-binding domain-containing protein [Spirochaetota bacterium]
MAKSIIYFQNGERIIEAGKVETRMYIILEGEVQISLSDKIDKINVALLKKGDFFGEISLFNKTPRSATATAIGNVKLAFIDNAEQLRLFLIKNPVFAAKMVTTLAQRLAKTDEILVGKVSELNRLKITRDV